MAKGTGDKAGRVGVEDSEGRWWRGGSTGDEAEEEEDEWEEERDNFRRAPVDEEDIDEE